MTGPAAAAGVVSVQLPWTCADRRCRRPWCEFWRIPLDVLIAGIRPARCPFCGAGEAVAGPMTVLSNGQTEVP